MNLSRKSIVSFVGGSLLLFGTVATNAAPSNNSFNQSQQTEIKSIVKDYLVQNPEILLEVSKALQKKQQQQVQKQASGAIDMNGNQLFNADGPVTGNKKGNVTLVEFFDYQCGHCKNMGPVISKLVSQDQNLRVVYKDFPIFGKGSNFAAKAAIASNMQGKYMALHDALLLKKERLSPAIILKAADSVGINTTKLKADMKSAQVQKILKANMKLAEKLRLMGTPAFVVAYTPNGKFTQGNKTFFVPGAATGDALQGLIKEVQQAK